MESQFPDIVNLNVGGNHTYVTLLSTLRKVEGSILARMFNGELPVYKDDKNRYFLDGDGSTFQSILDYLKYDQLPFIDSPISHRGFGFGGGLFGQPTTRMLGPNDILPLYGNAKKFGLTDLVHHLEQMSPVVISNKLQEYGDSKPGYDECIDKILAAIQPEYFIMRDHVAIRLIDKRWVDQEQCCDHVCQQSLFQAFAIPSVYGPIDATVDMPFDVECSVLAKLCYDLQQRGFTVRGRETDCDFVCSKNRRSAGGFVTRGQGYCCRQRLFLLNITLHENQHVPNNRPFGAKTGGLFGKPQENTQAFSFEGAPAQQQVSGFSFGASKQPTSAAFGQQKGSQSLFGGQSSFGPSGQHQQQQQQQQQPQQQPQQNAFGGFGSNSASFGQPSLSKSPFGQSSGFGTQQSSAFGKATPGLFGASKQQPSFGGFGSAPASGHVFGGTPSFNNNIGAAPSQTSGGLFGSVCTSDSRSSGDSSETPTLSGNAGSTNPAPQFSFGTVRDSLPSNDEQ